MPDGEALEADSCLLYLGGKREEKKIFKLNIGSGLLERENSRVLERESF